MTSTFPLKNYTKSTQNKKQKGNKITIESDEMKTVKQKRKINKCGSEFFEKINKIHKLLARMIRKKEKSHRLPLSVIRADIATVLTDINKQENSRNNFVLLNSTT